jgi:hypothetical protein
MPASTPAADEFGVDDPELEFRRSLEQRLAELDQGRARCRKAVDAGQRRVYDRLLR